MENLSYRSKKTLHALTQKAPQEALPKINKSTIELPQFPPMEKTLCNMSQLLVTHSSPTSTRSLHLKSSQQNSNVTNSSPLQLHNHHKQSSIPSPFVIPPTSLLVKASKLASSVSKPSSLQESKSEKDEATSLAKSLVCSSSIPTNKDTVKSQTSTILHPHSTKTCTPSSNTQTLTSKQCSIQNINSGGSSQSMHFIPPNKESDTIMSKSKTFREQETSNNTKDWANDVEFTDKDEVLTMDSQGEIKSVCKSIQPRDVFNQTEVKYIVEFNEFCQPLRRGGHILVKFLGYIAKMERFCPIGEDDWHAVSDKYKADIIECIESKFIMPKNPSIKDLALRRVGKSWRHFRYTLRKDFFKPNEKTKEEIYNTPPKGHSQSHWIRLVDYWYSQKFKKLSKNGKSARGSLTHMHTTGCTSYANLRAAFVEEKGREPSHLEFFLKTHKRKDGSFVDGTTSHEFLEKANSRIAESSNDVICDKTKVELENKVFNDLMFANEDPKRPIGFGYGVKKSVVYGVHSELKKRGYNMLSGNSSLMEEAIENVSKKNKMIEEQNQRLSNENEALKSQVDMHNNLFTALFKELRNGKISNDFLKAAELVLSREKV